MINFDPITDRLFVGTCPRSEQDLQLLRRSGVTGIVSLQTDSDYQRWGIDWEALQQSSLTLDLVLYRVPIVDFDAADLRQRLPLAVETLGRLLTLGHHLYLHCTAGQERSPAVAIGYLAWIREWGLERALEHVLSSRDCAPNEQVLRELDEQRSPSVAANR